MKTQKQIDDLKIKYQELYEIAANYVVTYNLKIDDIFKVKEDLRITCTNLNKTPIYLLVTDGDLFKKTGSIIGDWELVYIQSF